jgi:hypothetical protein
MVRKQQGKQYIPWYTVGGKMSDKDVKQQINIRFCVNVGKSASETLAQLTLAYGKCTMEKSSVSEWHRQFTQQGKHG